MCDQRHLAASLSATLKQHFHQFFMLSARVIVQRRYCWETMNVKILWEIYSLQLAGAL